MGKTGIIFDMDGTLWDSSEGVAKAWTEVLRTHPEVKRIVTQEDVRSVMGLTMTRISKILFPGFPPEKQKALMDECTDNENAYLAKHGGKLYPGLEETLQRLSGIGNGAADRKEEGGSGSADESSGDGSLWTQKRSRENRPRWTHYPLYIESNCESGYIEAFLDYYGFRRYFQDFLCFGDNLKGKAENIRILAERNQLDAYYYVGDIQADYDATVAAGGKFIHAAYGMGTVKEKVPELNAIRDLPELLAGLEASAPCIP